MISKNHRQNHDFQIVNYLLGSCHTPDAAYALCQDLREERFNAIENYKVSKIKEKAKILRAERLLASEDEADRLDGEAEMLEISNNAKTGEVLYNTACKELTFIDDCIAKLRPNCKYKDLPDDEACQLMQQEEWKLELIKRAENSMLSQALGIAADQIDTMRMHPEFTTAILPAIDACRASFKDGVKWLCAPTPNLLEMSEIKNNIEISENHNETDIQKIKMKINELSKLDKFKGISKHQIGLHLAVADKSLRTEDIFSATYDMH